MAVKLVLSNSADPSVSEEFVFDQEQITIGRDQGNDVYIVDPTRVVSKRHAEISLADDGFHLADLGSKNFTYLNNTRLESGRGYAIDDGDMFKLGDYEVTFYVLTPEPELEPEPVSEPALEFDKTMFDSGFVNPFSEGASKLSEAIQILCSAYEKETPNRREDALREAFADALDAEPHEAKAHVAVLLNVFRDPDATDPVQHSAARNVNGHTAAPIPREKALVRRSAPADDQVERVMDMLLHVISKLLSIPWEFRHEFVGHTIAQSTETEVLFSNDKERLRGFLLEEGIDLEETERRLALIEEGGDDVVLHQLAMLDGYKAVVQQGMHMMLREIDPSVAAEELANQGGLYRSFPRVARLVASWQLEEKFRELRGEDWSVTERRAYRPSFIRAYLARMSGGPKKP